MGSFALVVIGFAASALGGMLGMAGGIFVVPLLAIAGGYPIRVAIAASLVSVIACSSAGAAPYLRAGLTNLRLAVVLESATALGAVCGVAVMGAIPVSVLFALFAAILILSAQQMFARRGEVVVEPAPTSDRLRLGVSTARLRLALVLMYGAGLISALLGIGSGVLKIPAMDTALRLPIKVSSATSNLMIGVTASASAGAYFLRGAIVPEVAAPVAIGSVGGALVGARFLIRLANDRLRILFVIVLVVLAVLMVLGAAGVDVVRGAA